MRRVLLPALLLLPGCAQRLAVVDAVDGLPVAAEVRRLDSGSLLVEAAGYESWSGPPQERIALHPLWVRRFADERIAPRPAPPPCASCPGTRGR